MGGDIFFAASHRPERIWLQGAMSDSVPGALTVAQCGNAINSGKGQAPASESESIPLTQEDRRLAAE